MGELLTQFITLLDDKSDDKLTLASMMTEEGKDEWELLVEAMDAIDIMKIGPSIRKLNKKYNLNTNQEIAILAYIKILEMMLKRAKTTPEFMEMIGMMQNNTPKAKGREPYDGTMFG